MKEEIIIIGGGPAGAAAAIQLAKQQRQVRLLERQLGPHHKVCGEFISYEAAHYLENLGLHLPSLGAEAIRQIRFYNGEQELLFDLPFTAWSLSRHKLDSALLAQAELAGASVERGVVVKQLFREGTGWELITRNRIAAENVDIKLHTNTVFLASGKHELRGWRRTIQPERYKNLIGFKMHFSAVSVNQFDWRACVEIHLFDGGYAGLEPIEQGGVNLCFLIGEDIYKNCGSNWMAVLDWLAQTSSHLKQRLAHLTPLWHEPLAVSAVPYGYIHSPQDAIAQLFRLGDQTAVIPSFAGDGIAIALHTASLASRIYLSGGDAIGYQRAAYQDLLPPVHTASLLANLLSTRLGRKAAFRCAALWPNLLREMILRTRVGLRNNAG